MKNVDIAEKIADLEIEFEKVLPVLREEYPKLNAEILSKLITILLKNDVDIKPGERFLKIMDQLCWATRV